jgi:segregation and condensation protein A
MSVEELDEEIEFQAEAAEGEDLSVTLDGFEGPLSLLLDLARTHKVDLARISIAKLADQYLAFIVDLRGRMELAAEYLVMAAWLTYLKSRLILPQPQTTQDEPSPEALAEALRLKLMRLEEARAAAKRLMQLPQLGADVFLFGDPRPIAITREKVWRADILEMLNAYCREATKHVRREHRLKPRPAYSLTEARRRLEELLDKIVGWESIHAVTPSPEQGPDAPPPASYLASVFGAALELAREGKMELMQSEPFEALFVRAKPEERAP